MVSTVNSEKLKTFTETYLNKSTKKMTKRRPLKPRKPRQMSTPTRRMRSTQLRLLLMLRRKSWPSSQKIFQLKMMINMQLPLLL
jgi:hypothetical protein